MAIADVATEKPAWERSVGSFSYTSSYLVDVSRQVQFAIRHGSPLASGQAPYLVLTILGLKADVLKQFWDDREGQDYEHDVELFIGNSARNMLHGSHVKFDSETLRKSGLDLECLAKLGIKSSS